MPGCLDELEPASRELLLARYQRGETSDQAGARLGKSAVAIRQLLVRIKRAVASCVERKVPARPS